MCLTNVIIVFLRLCFHAHACRTQINPPFPALPPSHTNKTPKCDCNHNNPWHTVLRTTQQHTKQQHVHAAGAVLKVRVFKGHPDGVVSVKFKEAESAQKCVGVMDGRFFGGRRLRAHMYDGYTNYNVKVEESAEEQEARLEAYTRELEAKAAAAAAAAAASGGGGQPPPQ